MGVMVGHSLLPKANARTMSEWVCGRVFKITEYTPCMCTYVLPLVVTIADG